MQPFEEGLLCEETGQKQLERRAEQRASAVSGRRGKPALADERVGTATAETNRALLQVSLQEQ